MKKLQNCDVENCIPTPVSCSFWNGGDITFLGICNGDPLINVVQEIVSKLQDIAGDDLSAFDMDSLIDICKKNAPNEVTILTILNLVKENQVCLKDYLDSLAEQISDLLNINSVDVNLKCYQEFDNFGNGLSITRSELDQLIINNLCDQEGRIDTLEGKVINLQSQIDNIDLNPAVSEQTLATCVDPVIKPVSSQVDSIADAHCDLETATGNSADISSALANTPAGMNAEFGLLTGWILNPANLAENYNNLLIAFGNIWARTVANEECCAATCKDIELGFSAVFNEDGDGIIITFSSGAGTEIPAGFTDGGSTGTITDVDGNVETFNITITNTATLEVPITTLSLSGDLTINIDSVMSNGTLTCQKCLSKVVKHGGCRYCKITNTGTDGLVLIVFTSDDTITNNSTVIVQETTSTTTTTTAAP